MKSKLLNAILGMALVAGSGLTVNAYSQAKPETMVKQRQSAMVLQGKYFYGSLRPMAQGKVPYDAKLVAANAMLLDALARMPWDDFAIGTKDVKSATAAAAFTETAKFKEAQDRFLSEVSKLVATTKSGDEAAAKAQILAVDKTCGGCHQTFRERQ